MASLENRSIDEILEGRTVVFGINIVLSIFLFACQVNERDLCGSKNLTKVILEGLIPKCPVSELLKRFGLRRIFIFCSILLGGVLKLLCRVGRNVVSSKSVRVGFKTCTVALVGPKAEAL